MVMPLGVPGGDAADHWTVPEIMRAVQQIRGDVKDGFAALNQRLDKVVSQDVYAADRRLLEQQIGDLRADLESKKASHLHDMEAERAERERMEERLLSEVRGADDRRRNTLYFVALPVLLSVISLTVTILVAFKGG